MTRIAKMTFALIALLVVSACAQTTGQNQAFQNYDYGYSTGAYDAAYGNGESSVFKMNNYY